MPPTATSRRPSKGPCIGWPNRGTASAPCTSFATVRVVDLTPGAARKPEISLPAALKSLALSPDARMLVAGTSDGRIVVWNAREVTQLAGPLAGHTGDVLALAFSLDGSLLASGGDDRKVVLWDAKRWQKLEPAMTGHEGIVRSLAFQPSSRLLASGGSDNLVMLWDVGGHVLRRLLRGHTLPVFALAFSPDGAVLASGGADKSVILWDVAAYRPLSGPMQAHDDIISGMLFVSKRGTDLLSWDKGRAFLWNLDLNDWKKRACRMANRNLSKGNGPNRSAAGTASSVSTTLSLTDRDPRRPTP